MELARGADPASTTEGQELLDEPGVMDFSRNGYRCLTSNPFVADAFRNYLGPSFSKELMNELVRSAERQFDYDGSKSTVTEAMAVETVAGDDDLADTAGSDTELEEAGSEKGNRSDVVIPTVVRQALRRLHENTGHRSPQRLAGALVIAGAQMEAVIAAKQLRCSLCDERRPAKVQRPASLPAPRQPGDQVAVDIFDSFDATGICYSILHAVDAVTRFQMAVIVDKQSSQRR